MLNYSDDSSYDIIILGAGCAGMTLACRLAHKGYEGRVLLVDSRSDFSREQRWCSWGPINIPVPDAVTRSWQEFIVKGGGIERNLPTASAPYLHIESKLYLESIQAQLHLKPNFTLLLGCAVDSVDRDTSGHLWYCKTSSSSFTAPLVFDGRNRESEVGVVESDEPWLWQSFAGIVVQAEDQIFDNRSVTLMDFDVEDGDRGAFIYILPFSSNTALIESTLISRTSLSESGHRSKISKYIADHTSLEVSELSCEYGNIPMTTYRMPSERAACRYGIGISGGAAKPSTGYAFARIQQQSRAIAEQIVSGRTINVDPRGLQDRRRQWLDDVFITAAFNNERFFTQTILTMVRKLPPDLLVRFLAERSTLSDELSVMAAVGSPELVSAAAQVAARKH